MPPTGRRDNKLTAKRNQGCIPKKRSAGRLKQDLDKDFLTILAYIHVHSYTSKNCHSGSLVLSCDTATRVLSVCSRSILILLY